MKEQIVSFETAKLAKEKGFDVPIMQMLQVYHITTGKIDMYLTSNRVSNWNDNKYVEICSAPTQSLLQKWLREKHSLIVFVTPFVFKDPEGEFKVIIYRLSDQFRLTAFDLDTWEEALEKGLFKALKLI